MLTRLLGLKGGEVLLVRGPGMVRVEREGLSALGVPLAVGQRVVVRRNKVLPFESDVEDASLMVTLGEGGDYTVSSGSVGVKIWRGYADEVFSKAVRRLVVVGETDSGKSTFTTYLVNRALSSGLRVGVVDGDVGQGDLAPPGCVGAAVLEEPILDLRDIKAQMYGFVGATSPRFMLIEDAVVDEVGRLTDRLEGSVNFIVVNTDGYVADRGVDYKVRLIRRVKPNLSVCLDGGAEAVCRDLLYKVGSNASVAVVDRPEMIGKDHLEREERRLSQYRRFLRDSGRISLSLKGLKLCFLGVKYGGKVGEVPPDLEGELLSVAKGLGGGFQLAIRFGREKMIEVLEDGQVCFSSGSLHGMFVGLGVGGEITGFGVISKFSSSIDVSLDTPIRSKVDSLFLSTIGLSRDLKEEYTIPIIYGR